MTRARRGEAREWFEWAMTQETDECLLWPFAKSEGYGHMSVGDRRRGVHVLACERVHGPRPSDRPYAVHSCRRRECCNPRHVSWGSVVDNNVRDRWRDGTMPRGESHPNAKLTEAQVLAIRAAYDGRRGALGRLAREYGVDRSLIHQVIQRKAWRHL